MSVYLKCVRCLADIQPGASHDSCTPLTPTELAAVLESKLGSSVEVAKVTFNDVHDIAAALKRSEDEREVLAEKLAAWRAWAGVVLALNPETEPVPSDGRLRDLLDADRENPPARRTEAVLARLEKVVANMLRTSVDQTLEQEMREWSGWAYALIGCIRGEEVTDEIECAKMRQIITDACTDTQQQRDAIYTERNKVVAALARVAELLDWPVSLGKHEPAEGEIGWSQEWQNVLYIELPSGQVSWHVHDSDLPLFAGLPNTNIKWDGHTSEQKYERLALLKHTYVRRASLVFEVLVHPEG